MKHFCTSKSLGGLVLATILAVSANATARSEPPSFFGLGFASPASQSGAAGAISADGRYIIGSDSFGCDLDGNCTGIGWVWNDGQFQSINSVVGAPAGQRLYASGISHDGGTLAIVDWDSNQSSLWRDGNLTPLSFGAPTWQIQDFATGVSDDGNTVSGGRFDALVGGEGWRWRNGTRVPLGDLQVNSTYIGSVALGVSPDGHVILGQAMSASTFNQAFRWSDGQMTSLGYLRDEIIPDPIFPKYLLYPESTANAASFDGAVIVGNSPSYNTRLFETEAFRWENGVMVGLGDLPGGMFYSDALSVSADGSIIVGTGVMEGGHRAFIWDELHGMRLLEDVLTNAGIDLQGWKLVSATDISADGTIIVGKGLNADGVLEPFRAVVPEPASMALVVLGAAAISCRRLPKCRMSARL